MIKLTPVIRAIDVGHRYTKYTSEVNNDIAKSSFFSSRAYIESKRSKLKNTFKISVNGKYYTISSKPDLVGKSTSPSLDSEFVGSNYYIALIYGALAQMSLPKNEIDLLIIGVPRDLPDIACVMLEERLTGKHSIVGKTISISEVQTIDQSLGGVKNISVHPRTFSQETPFRSLLIDAGFFKINFTTMSNSRVIPSLSGYHKSGINTYHEAITKSLNKYLDLTFDYTIKFDEIIKSSRFENPTNLIQHHEQAMLNIIPSLKLISEKVKGAHCTNQIILTGGAARLIEDSIHSLFPHHFLVLPHNPMMTNVLGLQKIGEQSFSAKQEVA